MREMQFFSFLRAITFFFVCKENKKDEEGKVFVVSSFFFLYLDACLQNIPPL